MSLDVRLLAIAAVAMLALAPGAGFAQAEPAVPPVGEAAPDAGTATPQTPEQAPLPRVLPTPPIVLPPAGPSIGGRDCESERSPSVGT
jgi:hypothetical protein